jgi:hypothetical protein
VQAFLADSGSLSRLKILAYSGFGQFEGGVLRLDECARKSRLVRDKKRSSR